MLRIRADQHADRIEVSATLASEMRPMAGSRRQTLGQDGVLVVRHGLSRTSPGMVPLLRRRRYPLRKSDRPLLTLQSPHREAVMMGSVQPARASQKGDRDALALLARLQRLLASVAGANLIWATGKHAYCLCFKLVFLNLFLLDFLKLASRADYLISNCTCMSSW